MVCVCELAYRPKTRWLPPSSWCLSQEVKAFDLRHCVQLFLPRPLFLEGHDFIHMDISLPSLTSMTYPAFQTGHRLSGLEFLLEWEFDKESFC